MSDQPTSLDDYRQRRILKNDENEPWNNVFALCVACTHRWLATVPISVSLLRLECPQCHNFESFPSFIPEGWLETLDTHYRENPPPEDPLPKPPEQS
jgi:hypothetical protein